MKFNKKYCLLFLMTILVLLLGAGMVSASEAGNDVQVVKDNYGLSTPNNYDVDKVVQSDYTKSDANVEKTSTKYDKDLSDTTKSTFVNQTDTNDNPIYSSKNGHSVGIVEGSTLDDKLIDLANPTSYGLMHESADVVQFSTSPVVTEDLTSSEKMTPIFTEVAIDNDSSSVMKKITQGNVKTADDDSERYSVMYYKTGSGWSAYTGPYIMNDSTIVFSLNTTYNANNNMNPHGYSPSIAPGVYKRITLTDDYQLINPRTGEDVMPYIRTLIYKNLTYTSASTLVNIFATQNYRTYGSYRGALDYIIDLVESGQGKSSYGDFNVSKNLKYQFYLYQSDSEVSSRHYMDLIGLNLLTDIKVNKVWDDEGNEDKRPDSVQVQLYANGEKMGSPVSVTAEDGWNHTFTDVPVYFAYNFDSLTPLTYGEDYEATLSEPFDIIQVHLHKVWDPDYTGTQSNYVFYSIYGNGKFYTNYAMTRNTDYGTGNWNTDHILPYADENGNPIEWTIIETNQTAIAVDDEGNLVDYHGNIEMTVSGPFQACNVTYVITNDDLKHDQLNFRLFIGNTELLSTKLSESDNWTFEPGYGFLLEPTDNPADFDVYLRPSTDVINYTIEEINYGYNINIAEQDIKVGPLSTRGYVNDELNPLAQNFTITNRYYEQAMDLQGLYGLKYVLGENTTISNETYSVVVDWSGTSFTDYSYPWLMNDTTWVQCMEPHNAIPDPDGSGYYIPATYRRISLSDDDKLIHPITGEDILPFLRTMVYYYTLYPEQYNIPISRAGAPTFQALLDVFTYGSESDYRDSQSSFNRRAWNGGTVWDWIEPILEMVDSGNAVSSSGIFNNSDFLTYQFYMYVNDETNMLHYQQTLGFNVLTNIDITKVWDDNNLLSTRPGNISVQLYADGEAVGDVVQLNRSNNWTYKYSELPVYSINTSVPITSDDYDLTSESETCYNITIQKIWDESYTGTKPSYVYINIYMDGQMIASRYRLYRSYGYEDYFDYFTKYDPEDGHEIVYTFEDVTSYGTGIDPASTGNIEITEKSDDFDVKTFTYSITNEELRDDPFTVGIHINGGLYDVAGLSSSNDWTFSIYNLPIDIDEEEIVLVRFVDNTINVINYTVGEINISDEYTSTTENNTASVHPLMTSKDENPNYYVKYLEEDLNDLLTSVTITNTREFTVKKVWEDSDNKDLIRPETITVNIKADGETVTTVILDESNNWTKTIRDLPKYDEEGNAINYTVEEAEVPEDYNVSYSSDYNYHVITNTHIPKLYNITVTKIWNDENNTANYRPENVTVQLLANGEVYNETTLNETNNWTYTFTDLPGYIKGKKVEYTFNESPVPTGYVVSYGDITPVPVKSNTNISIQLLNVTMDEEEGNAAKINVIVREEHGTPVSEGDITVTDGEGSEIFHGTLTDGIAVVTIPVELVPGESPVGNAAMPAIRFNINVDYEENDLYHASNNSFTSFDDTFVYVVVDSRQVSLELKYVTINGDNANASYLVTVTDGNNSLVENAYIVLTNSRGTTISNTTLVDGKAVISIPVKIMSDNISEEGLPDFMFNATILYYDEIFANTTMPIRLVNETRAAFTTSIEKRSTSTGNMETRSSHGEPSAPWLFSDGVWTYCIDPSLQYYGWETITPYIPIYPIFDPDNIILNNNLSMPYLKVSITNDTDIAHYLYENLGLTYNPDALEAFKTLLYLYADDSNNFELNVNGESSAIHNMIHIFTELITDSSDPSSYWPLDIESMGGQNLSYYINKVIDMVNAGEVPDNHGIKNYTEGGRWEYQFYMYYPYTYYFGEKLYQRTIGIEYYFVPEENPYETNITNELHLVNVTVNKVWDDDDNRDGVRPDNVTVKLLQNGEEYLVAVLDNSTGWSYNFTDLPKYDDEGELVEYSIVELPVTGYNTTISDNSTGVLVVQMDWEGYAEEEIPDSLDVVIYGNDEVNVTLSPDNNWTYILKDQPMYNGSDLISYGIEYTLDEDNYYMGLDLTNITFSFVMNNTHVPEVVNISVEKIWNDSDNQDNLRPENITVGLFGNHYLVDWVVLEDPNWTYTFENLPKYDAGEPISYYVNEVELIRIGILDDPDFVMYFAEDYVPAGYAKEIIECCNDDVTYIINTHVPEKTNITVVKNWTDDNNKVNVRPPNIVVHVYAGEDEAADPIVLSEDNNWEGTFTDLDVYDNGEKINYVVVEDVPNNYTASYNYTVNITVSREFTDILRGLRSSDGDDTATFDEGDDSATFTDDDEDTVTLNLIDGDGNIIDSVSISINQYYNAEHLNYTFADLPVYDDNDEVINYSITGIYIDEPLALELYRDINMTYSYAVSINNTITGVTDINVSKVWNDNENNDGKRPKSVTVNLVIDGEVSDITKELNNRNNWTAVFEELEMYHENGTLIVYNVTEPVVPENYELTDIVFCEGAYKVINTHVPEIVNLTVNKIWDDANNTDGKRPEFIVVELLDGGNSTNKFVVLNESNTWSGNFTDLPVYRDGIRISYTINETAVPEGYELTYGDLISYGTIKTANVTVELVQEPYDLFFDKATIKFVLKHDDNVTVIDKDAEPVVNITLTNEIDITKDSEKINVEDYVEYIKSILSLRYGIDLDNIESQTENQPDYVKELVSVLKTLISNEETIEFWMNESTEYSIPDMEFMSGNSLSYYLNNVVNRVSSLIGDTGNGWTYEFDIYIPKTQYTVNKLQHSVVLKYVSLNDMVMVTNLTNTHEPITKNITVVKDWDDDENNDGVRPTEVAVDLYADDVFNMTVDLKGDDWTYTFTDLPVYKDGEVGVEIVYTIVEHEIANYTSVVTNVSDNFTVTNTHENELVNITVYKKWNDADNQDGMQTENVTIVLKADGTEVGRKVLHKFNDWTELFTDLPKYADGKPIEYSVEELEVPGYTVNITNDSYVFTVNNTHVPKLVNITVIKEWNDSENIDGLRPETVTIVLLADGQVSGVPVVLDADGTWKYTFENLPEYSNGRKINYTVNETEVPEHYTVSYDVGEDIKVINTHEHELTEINVTKVWDDNDNQDGIRPDSVTINVLAYGEVVRTATISEEDEWTYTFGDLPVYNGSTGERILYYIEEVTDDLPEGYEVSFEELTYHNITVINSRDVDKVEVNVTKVWTDNDNQDGIRPDYIYVQLYGATEISPREPVGNMVKLSEENKWSYIFKGLDKNSQGHEIIYDVGEIEVPEGYTSEYNPISLVWEDNYVIIINNTHVPELTNVSVEKVWDDNNNNDGKRVPVTVNLVVGDEVIDSVELNESNNWKHTFGNLTKYDNGKPIVYNISEADVPEGYVLSDIVFCEGVFKVVNTHEPELVNKTVYKEWNDADNQDNMRPKQVTVKLKSSDGREYVAVLEGVNNKWNYTFTDLPKYSNKEEIVYTVEESVVVDGYSVEYDQDALTVVNTHEPITKNITVLKVWDDNDNNDGVRPENVTIDLYADNVFNQSVDITGPDWKHTFENLTVYKAGEVGVEIVYTIVEHEITNYTSVVTNVCDNFTVTNTHRDSKVNITITKEWDDDSNNDNIRPDFVSVRLLADGNEYATAVVEAGDDWTYTFTDLPEYNNTSKIKYSIEEVNVPKDYTYSVDGLTITNTHIPYVTSVNVTKVWNDNNNADKTRCTEIVVELYADNVKINETTLNDGNEWKATFDNLPVNKDGVPVVYTISEVSVDYYETSVTENNGNYIITNTLVPELVNVTVNKTWDDNNDQDDIRPDSVTVQILNGDTVVQTAVMTGTGNNWNYTFTNLPKYDMGVEIVYTVEEIVPAGYNVTVNGYEIVNTHVPYVTDINVTKVWDDNDDNDNARSTSVAVELTADGKVVRTATLDDGNDWSATFDNLPVNKEGKPIVYNISEVTVNDHYVTSITENNGNFVITNTLVPEVVNVTVNKVWNDSSNQDAIRPAEVTLKLKADGQEYVVKVVETGNGDWTYTFTDLPKFSNGKEIVYTVEEVNVAKGYTVTYSEDTLTVVNTHVPEETEINVAKVWNDADNQDGKRPDSVTVDLLADGVKVDSAVLSDANDWQANFSNLPVNENGKAIVYSVGEASLPTGYTSEIVFCEGVFKVINTYIPENTSISVSKVWEDADNQDAIRPDAVFVQIMANGEDYILVKLTGENDWTLTITDLPKYADGQEIVYTIVESEVPDGYTAVVDGLTITNTHVPIVTSVNVTKVWNDNNNNDGVRPDEVSVDLLADGNVVDSAVLSADNDWKATFENLPVNKDGKEIVYTISERDIDNYVSEIIECCGNFQVTNTHNDSTVELDITKVWVDDDNRDAIRPDTVSVRILADGEEYVIVVVKASDDWAVTVTDLPEFNAGSRIVYSVEEVEVPLGYVAVVDDMTITNTHDVLTTEVNVSKVWNDNNDNDGVRPDSVTVYLYADGVEVDSVVLSADNDWKATFSNLPVNKDGEEIVYTISENAVEGYVTAIVNCNGTYKVVNTHNDSTVELDITKVWVDDDNRDAIRPDTVSVRILADGEEYVIVVVKASDDWAVTVTDLPEFNAGSRIVYSVEEVEVPLGYVAVVDDMTITNTHDVLTTEVNVSKVWNDNNDNDGVRPDSVTVYLYADGVEVDSVVLSADNDWKATFSNLPVNKDGEEIVYTISENAVEGYVTAIVNCNGTYKVVNTHNDSTVELDITKVWVDDDNRDAIRPDTVSVRILADGEEYVIVVVKASDDWAVTVTDLPEFNAGSRIVYSVEEVEVPLGYVAVVDDTTITNTHEILTTEVNVSKVWNDNNDNDGVRPDSVTVYLYADGVEVDSVVLSDDNDWKHTFGDLPLNDNGEEIVYTIGEDSVADYTTVVVNCNGTYKVVNTHNVSTVELNITKVWEDADNQDGIRPNNVTVEVLANGNRFDIIVINSTGNWKYTIADLPEFINGEKVVYTVKEINVANDYASVVDGLTITNTHIPELTNVSVVKVWNDDDNNDGLRPDGVTVELLADGNVVDTYVLTAGDDWKHTFSNLAKYADGHEIVYTVGEGDVPAGYTAKVVFCEGEYKVINTYIPENTTVSVSKVWNDANNQDGIRPASVTIKVMAGGAVVQTATVTEADGWTYTFTNLPKYNNGQEIVYTVEEVVPAGYDVTYNGNEITNTHIPDVTEINVTKIWNDNDNNDGQRPDSVTVKLLDGDEVVATYELTAADEWKHTFTDLPVNREGKQIVYTVAEDAVEGYTTDIVNCEGIFKVINSHNDSVINLSIEKIWDDHDNQDAIRPENISVRLLADGKEYLVAVVKADDWTYTFTNLPEYSNANKIVYTIEEVSVPKDYTVTYDQEALTITNCHEIYTRDINVSKVWNDSDNNDGKRPASVTVYLNDDEGQVRFAVLSADNDWKATFENLPVNKDGKEINYTLGEVEVEDYVSTIADCCGNFNVINTYIPVNTTITVSKVWEDEDNQDGLRPESVTVKVLAGDVVVQTATITEDDDWTYTFTNLPKYNNGQEIVYTVEEVVPAGYNVTYNGNEIINTHIPDVTVINVVKVWNDSDDNDGIRPAEVTVSLLAGDEVVETVVLSEDNNWKVTFTDLPVNKDGKKIVYSITEDPVDDYTTEIEDNCGNFSIVNTHINITINLTVYKVWVDENNNDGLRTDSVTVRLLADGVECGVGIITGSDWFYTFHDLPEYNAGKLVEYTFEEVEVPAGYECAVEDDTLVNTHEIITKNITVTKVWNDNNNNDGVRPVSVEVKLYADGQYQSSLTLSEDNDWKDAFTNLRVYNAGKVIDYTIVEENVTDYRTSYEGNVIINTHDQINTSVTVKKNWIDVENENGVRPDSVSVHLYANGNEVASTLLSSNNSWTYTFDNLAKYENGQLIDYEVREESVEGYETTITEDSNYFIINNKHDVLINLTINKIWNDTDNKYGKRPDNVTVNVFADGKQIDSVVLSEDNDWVCNLNDLPKYDNGKVIDYTVDEVNITYYHYSIDKAEYSFTVTNTLNNVRVFKWAWKLIGDNGSYYVPVEIDDNEPADKVIIKKNTNFAAKGKGIGKYQPRYNIPAKKKYSWNNNHRKEPSMRKISWQWYRLYIYLFREYFYGNMTFSEFVAILQENGIQIDESNAWNSNGTLIFDYDTLEEVPDSIELHDNGGHVKDSSDRVEKYKPRSDSGVIDSGEIVAEVVDVEE